MCLGGVLGAVFRRVLGGVIRRVLGGGFRRGRGTSIHLTHAHVVAPCLYEH